ncbi:hypothetical protein LTR27_008422 [Elasticomyces elasticus]|nr:hypothetical protein LTR27_008422 [Elasticomyces elasticus]
MSSTDSGSVIEGFLDTGSASSTASPISTSSAQGAIFTTSSFLDSTASGFIDAPPAFSTSTPLTTVFSPAPTCTDGPWTSVNSTQGTITCTRSLASNCYPSNFDANASVLYSPGVCPSQYTAAASWTTDGSNATTSACCPSGMAYLQIVSSCSAILGSTKGGTANAATVLISPTLWLYGQLFTAYAPVIGVAWASTDLEIFTPASAPLLATLFTESPNGAPPSDSSSSSTGLSPTVDVLSSSISSTTSASSPQLPSSSHAAMSTGETVGISVGATIVGILLLALGAWLLFLRRKKKSQAITASSNLTDGKAELPGDSNAEKLRPHAGELETRGEIFEFAGQGKPAELEPHARYELEGGFHGHEAGVVRSPTT